MELLLGLDAGTTSLKAGLFRPDGQCLAVARQEYQLSSPHASWAEMDPEVYWQACVAATHEVLSRADVDSRSVLAVSVSSQGETLIALDSAGGPVYPAIAWLDNRATTEARTLAEKFSKDVYRITGIPEIIPTWTACKILWLKQHEPDVFARARRFLLVQDYLMHRLTGHFVTNGSVACTTLYFDIVNNRWWQPVLDAIGVRTEYLPRLVPAGEAAGGLSADAARQVGLAPSTKVIGGGMDQSVGAIGAGNIVPGIVSETTGAALTIQATILAPDKDKNKVVPVYSHSIPGGYLFVPVCPTAGMTYKWFRDAFGEAEIVQGDADGVTDYDRLNLLAEEAPAGCEGLVLLPHLMGAYSPEPNPEARGSFTGFTLRHGRGHFARAILEGVAFMLRRNLEALGQAGIEVQEIRSTGGGARSRLWNQIKANVVRAPVVTLANEETALLGNAILAGVATGLFTTVADGCARMVAVKEKFLPNAEAAAYVGAYQRYCDLDRSLNAFFVRQYGDASKT
jgi:xylulokinase